MILINCEQGSEQWHIERAGRVTGTRFKDLMAGKSTAGYTGLIADLATEIITGEPVDSDGYVNKWMERGIELEPEAAEFYSTITGIEIQKVGFVIPDEGHPFHEWVGVSPDRFAGEGLLEIKCPKNNTHLKYIAAGKMPTEYFWQVQGQLFVTGLPWCDFFSYYPGLKPFLIRVYPDAVSFATIEKELSLMVTAVKSLIEAYNAYK